MNEKLKQFGNRMLDTLIGLVEAPFKLLMVMISTIQTIAANPTGLISFVFSAGMAYDILTHGKLGAVDFIISRAKDVVVSMNTMNGMVVGVVIAVMAMVMVLKKK